VQFLLQRFDAALLRYLAVAHFGRGRGDWVEGEYPPHWHALVAQVTASHRDALSAVFGRMDQVDTHVETLAASLRPIAGAAGREVLVRLYPGAEAIFLSAPRMPIAVSADSRG
jgi:hypothetical protein